MEEGKDVGVDPERSWTACYLVATESSDDPVGK